MTLHRMRFSRPSLPAPGFAAVVALVLSVSANAVAGEIWTKVPTAKYVLNNKQDALAFGNDRNDWYGNGTGTVYGTTDGGKTWKSVWTRSGTYVRALEFADDKVGFLGNV